MKFWPFRKKQEPEPEGWNIKHTGDDVKIFDLRNDNKCWGHSVDHIKDSYHETREGGKKDGSYWKFHGWLTPRPSTGDMLIVDMKKGAVVTIFVEIDYWRDPRDSFTATVGAQDYLKNMPEIQKGLEDKKKVTVNIV